MSGLIVVLVMTCAGWPGALARAEEGKASNPVRDRLLLFAGGSVHLEDGDFTHDAIATGGWRFWRGLTLVLTAEMREIANDRRQTSQALAAGWSFGQRIRIWPQIHAGRRWEQEEGMEESGTWQFGLSVPLLLCADRLCVGVDYRLAVDIDGRVTGAEYIVVGW